MNNVQSANIIKNLCREQNIAVSVLLNDCGIRKGLIYDMEKRDKTPSPEILEQVANYFNCSVDYLLGREEQQKKPIPVTEEDGLDEVERQIMSYVRTMDPAQKDTLVAFLRTTVSRNQGMPTSVPKSSGKAVP